jgi:hypothetical protein
MIEKFRRDNIWMGLLIGLFVPAALFGILYGIIAIIEHFTGNIAFVSIQKVLLLSIVPNLFLLRYYLLKLKYDLTGRGILAMTFILGILFIILEFTI